MSCPDCFRGGIAESKPTGSEEVIHGRSTYVAKPEPGVTPKGLIVFITDAFGWKFVNNRVLSDCYAKAGFLVYCPDFMDGFELDPQALGYFEKIMEPKTWSESLCKPYYIFHALRLALPFRTKASIPITHPRVISFLQDIRRAEAPFPTENLKVGVAGFCWGAKHGVLLAHDKAESRVQRHTSQKSSGQSEPQPLIDAFFAAHPSYFEVPQDIDAIVVPTSIAVGDADMAMKGPVAQQAKKALEAKSDAGQHEFVIMPGAKHGFAIRTKPDDPHQQECADKAEAQAVAWFTKWLS
ncbi:unnamed protein product [Clonostachys byssicola]|uniref:Dienelactone hydrolase domain-containing protein n=1 Tax=Clonostachys byssicola TaxID=160290 RepID=A0A9N9UCF8_9HYPO|nr:unnamed protein product [Clonostachys byssicola]